MPRRLRMDVGGIAYHVLNRRVGRLAMFDKDADYLAFEKVLAEAGRKVPMRLLAYCLMPNHWHLVLWPRQDGHLSRYMQWLTTTHMRRWHAHHGTRGTGPLYQGRYKSFPVQEDVHFLTVCRYVAGNALRAGMVERAENWRWSSLARRRGHGSCDWLVPISDWPVEAPDSWAQLVNAAQTEQELKVLRRSIARGCPYGDPIWQERTAVRLKLQSSLRDPWRPTRAREGNK